MSEIETPAATLRRPVGLPDRQPEHLRYPITRRQVEALTWVANGHTNAAIAARMGISGNTVAALLGKAFAKLGAADRAQAVAIGLRVGLIPLQAVELPEAVSGAAGAAPEIPRRSPERPPGRGNAPDRF